MPSSVLHCASEASEASNVAVSIAGWYLVRVHPSIGRMVETDDGVCVPSISSSDVHSFVVSSDP